jgi:ferric-dicitrate binding protein FerR (iron transport regulator)
MSSSISGGSPLETDEARRRRGRRVALLILALCAMPTVAAWLAYFVWQPESRANYGELIEPRPLRDSELRLLDGRPFRLSQLRGKWVLLHIDSGACTEECRKKLVYMRQARLAQGKAMTRVERVWLVTDPVQPEDALAREFEGTQIARTEGSAVVAEFPAPRSRADHIYVVDPLGNLMLRFPADPDPRGIVKDLARLLRASRIG